MSKRRKIFLMVFGGVIASLVIAVVSMQINDPITREDKYYSHLFLQEAGIDTSNIHKDFNTEVAFIVSVQKAIQGATKIKECIPYDHTRNIKDLYKYKCGLCYDKSHALEQILRTFGFKTRHISVYFFKTPLQKFINPFLSRSESHAASEVLTSEGWMFFDSLTPYIGFADGKVMKLSEVRKRKQSGAHPEEFSVLTTFHRDFVFVYGVYSRNGHLYPPYNFVPDYKLSELRYNLFP